MSDDVRLALTLVTAVGCGVAGGVFFAFSAFVMAALGRLPPAQGIAAMQSINVAAVSPPFMVTLFGPALGCAALAVSSLRGWQGAASLYPLAGGLLYLLGTILVTIVCNVPRNVALAGLDPGSADGAVGWAWYVPAWTAWNTVRTVAAIGSAALLTAALVAE